MTTPPAAPENSLVGWAQFIYGLHAFSLLTGILGAATVFGAFLTGWPSIIAVILNYVKRGEVRGTWLESHFRWQIRTFWFGLLWVSLCLLFIVATFGIGILIAWLPLGIVGLWFIYRIVRGWMALNNGKPMYQVKSVERATATGSRPSLQRLASPTPSCDRCGTPCTGWGSSTDRSARRDEPERVAADVHVGDGLLDLRHVAGHAFAARAAALVMRVILERGRVRAVRRAGTMARRAQLRDGLDQVRVVRRAVNVVAAEARHALRVHHALDEVVALHAVLVRGAVREVRERRLAELVLFELPEVLQAARPDESRRASRRTARRLDS